MVLTNGSQTGDEQDKNMLGLDNYFSNHSVLFSLIKTILFANFNKDL